MIVSIALALSVLCPDNTQYPDLPLIVEKGYAGKRYVIEGTLYFGFDDGHNFVTVGVAPTRKLLADRRDSERLLDSEIRRRQTGPTPFLPEPRRPAGLPEPLHRNWGDYTVWASTTLTRAAYDPIAPKSLNSAELERVIDATIAWLERTKGACLLSLHGSPQGLD